MPLGLDDWKKLGKTRLSFSHTGGSKAKPITSPARYNVLGFG